MTPEEVARQAVDCSGCHNVTTLDGTHDQYCRITHVAAAIRDAYERAAKTLDDEVVALSREAERIREIDHKHASYCHALASRAAAYAAAIRKLKGEG